MATVYPKEFFDRSNKRFQKGTCFVLMPFDPKFGEVYDVIRETLQSEALNMECNRADDFHRPHIVETILKEMVRAEYIIADLTESNANVFYELGLAHSIKDIDKVVILTQDMKYVPFDLRQFRCIVYDQSIAGSKKLSSELVKTFEEAGRNSFRLTVKENRRIPFAKRLSGKENYLYGLEFESPYIGHDGIKLQIHFTRFGADKSRTELDTQFLYLSNDGAEAKIENIPWTVSLIKSEGEEAKISIDRR